MRANTYAPQDRIFDPRPLVASIGSTDDARKSAQEHFRAWAEDCPNFRANDRAMRSNRGTL